MDYLVRGVFVGYLDLEGNLRKASIKSLSKAGSVMRSYQLTQGVSQSGL